jgi:hypothetical protein
VAHPSHAPLALMALPIMLEQEAQWDLSAQRIY